MPPKKPLRECLPSKEREDYVAHRRRRGCTFVTERQVNRYVDEFLRFCEKTFGHTSPQRIGASDLFKYGKYLERLTEGIEPDDYSLGGIVAELEQKMAAILGKEFAVWMPTGTLANHLAVRLLAGEKRRVLVQQERHLYNDCGDCCQTLSGLNLVPLAPGRATFTLEDVQHQAERTASGRVAVPIGAIQIETPVRRKTGEAFDFAEMKRISAWARERGVGLHLDGARLFLASAYSRIPVRQYTTLFDTVYVSLYKYFNAASGAILAGPRSLLENSFHTRRMFGGGLCHVWAFAAVAMHYLEGFEARYAKAVAVSQQVIAGLEGDGRFAVTRVPRGTNIFYLRVQGGNADAYRQRALEAGIALAEPRDESFSVQVNETWNRAAPAEILARLRRALS
jgi:threonine aldolase